MYSDYALIHESHHFCVYIHSGTSAGEDHSALPPSDLSLCQLGGDVGPSSEPSRGPNIAAALVLRDPSLLVDVEVALGSSSRDILLRGKTGVVQSIGLGDIAKVYVSHLGQEIKIPACSLQPVAPRMFDTVKVLNVGKLAGAIGKIVSVAFDCAVVKFDSSDYPDLIQLSLNGLGKCIPRSSNCPEPQATCTSSTSHHQAASHDFANPFLLGVKAQSLPSVSFQRQPWYKCNDLKAVPCQQLATSNGETQSDNSRSTSVSTYPPPLSLACPVDFPLSSSSLYSPVYNPLFSSSHQQSSIYTPALASSFVSSFPVNQQVFTSPLQSNFGSRSLPPYPFQCRPNPPGYSTFSSNRYASDLSELPRSVTSLSQGLNTVVHSPLAGLRSDLQEAAGGTRQTERRTVEQLLKEVLQKQSVYRFSRSQGGVVCCVCTISGFSRDILKGGNIGVLAGGSWGCIIFWKI